MRNADRLTAVLGPTNTGKTHLAVERMLGHRTGMIGLPLRLLAREIYDRVAARVGRGAVALITGEEKRVPASPRYYVCTVEAMPLDRRVDFLAVDEIQLCADAERGHVFTDRLLHARGRAETMVLGAETIRPLIRRLVPEATFIKRPRLSKLSFAGARALGRLPPRSAVVAFSAADVYGIAEYMRRQRGGAAVVLGALSPRTRNAQVALYQAGEVDYMVATDAIGMGLNMDVNHVAFAALRKFDGRSDRALTAAELAQIAGRAGRHMNDGSFGATPESGPIPPDVIEAVESHRFPPLRRIFWRNGQLRFTSLKALLASLDAAPPAPELLRAPEATDHLALAALARDERIARLAANPDAVRLLWEVCRIPDYRKIMSDAHVRLLTRIYRHLMEDGGRLPDDWVASVLARLDRTDGDIDTLATRIAHVRTWTYVSNRADWLADAAHWRGRARAVEDRLSDALHDRLTQRFIDRRTAVLMRGMKGGGRLATVVEDDGAVAVEGHFIGRLDGFRFVADAAEARYADRALWNAAKRALADVIRRRAEALVGDPDDAFAIDERARVRWRGATVARLIAGPSPLDPRIALIPSELLAAPTRTRIEARLVRWLAGWIAAEAGPLRALATADLRGSARGIAYQVGGALGTVPRRGLEGLLGALDADDRKALARLGIRLGRESVFQRDMLKPRQVAARALLWTVHGGRARVPPVPPAGRVSVAADAAAPEGFYDAIGYRRLGGLALRVDIVERIAAEARRLSRAGPFAATPMLGGLAGCSIEEMGAVLVDLGYRRARPDGNGAPRFVAPPGATRRRSRKSAKTDGGKARSQKPSPRPKPPARGKRRARVDPASPFAKLATLRSTP